MSPARARTRSARSGVERTNHEATAPPLAKRTEILDKYSANKNVETQNIDEATYEWYQKARLDNIPVTGPMLQEKAKRASEELGDSELTASNGWLDRFKKRFNVKSKVKVVRQEVLRRTL